MRSTVHNKPLTGGALPAAPDPGLSNNLGPNLKLPQGRQRRVAHHESRELCRPHMLRVYLALHF
jgi:hypothetical protein